MQHSLKDMVQTAALMLHQGKNQEAFDVCCVALKDKNAPRIVNLIMAQTSSKVMIKAYNPVIKDALLQTIEAYGVEAQLLASAWIKMLYQDSAFDPLHVFFKNDYVFKAEDWQAFETCIKEPFFIAGLKNLVIENREIEIALRNIRKILLQNLLPQKALKTKHLDFICALAENCYANEYAFFTTEEEKAQFKALSLDDPFNIAISACYESLYGKAVDQKCSAVSAFKHLMQVQIKEPEEEQALKATINTLASVDNEVSRKVQNMYEKNPYPRWRTLNVAAGKYEYAADVLIAGCGTGRYLIQSALMFSEAKFTAVDITRASLAYSMRMAKFYDVKNIDFAQCDILELERVGKKFDFINCSGVLHHMEDPVAGWRSLIGRLNAGGVMMVGLYSTIARKVIFESRDEIKKLGIQSDDDGLRAFRNYVFVQPPGNKFERLTTFKDFYTLSETRDLLFHVQEKTYTIPELSEILDELGLEFGGFKMPSPDVASAYREDFPHDPQMLDLKNWDEFERRHPNVFAGMYNFLCKKKGDTTRNIKTEQLIQTGVFT